MVIGVIGASLAGLTVARELGKQGHQVTVFEQAATWAGRFTTVLTGTEPVPVDTHVPYILAHGTEFKALMSELSDKGLIKKLNATVSSSVNGELSSSSMLHDNSELYTSTKGMTAVAGYMARYCDVKFNAHVVGITHIGTNAKKKLPWMINLNTFEVFEADAIVVALPAPQAYAVLENTQDESPVRRVLADIDIILYDATYTLTAVYPNKSLNDWAVLEVSGNDIALIVNESVKTDSKDLILTFHSSANFFNAAKDLKSNQIIDHLLKSATSLIGDFAFSPDSTVLEKRKYTEPEVQIDRPFINVEGMDGKLALVGDYFKGNSLEESYISGIRLAESWK